MKLNVFAKAAVLTFIVFFAGLAAGIWLDSQRTIDVRDKLLKIELDLSDARIQSQYFDITSGGAFCGSALKSNTAFAGKIYKEGLEIEKYEKINRFDPSLLLEKKRYALLQLQFWLNGLKLKRSCGFNYSTILYFYSQLDENLKTGQEAQSNVLVNLIHNCKNQPLVIPLPLDLDISSVDQIKAEYKISKAPSLLINEKTVLAGLKSEEEIKKHISC